MNDKPTPADNYTNTYPKRYLVFAGNSYSPIGGWDDLNNSYNDLSQAQEQAKRLVAIRDWVHVVDTHQHKIVFWQNQKV